MKYKKKLATIDTQDALIGNRAYDLASLIDDVRFKTSKKLKENIYNHYLKVISISNIVQIKCYHFCFVIK